MADIAASDVVYTLQSREINGGGYSKNVVKVAFGNSTLTYPSGGVALTKGKLGVPNSIRSLKIIDQDDGNGYVYKYDFENGKIKIYRSAGFTPAGTVAAPVFTGSLLDTHTHSIPSGTDGAGGTSGATSGGTPAGTNSAPAFTGSAVAAGVLTELSAGSTAPAAAVLYVEVEGY